MKKRSWKQELARFDIHMRSGREKFLSELAGWYERMYPERADWFKTNLRRLREVTSPDGSYSDSKGRQYFVQYRIPTELLLFIQRWIPDFGQDSADIDLLCRVFCDLVRPCKDHRRRTLLVTENYRRHVEPIVAKDVTEPTGTAACTCKEGCPSTGACQCHTDRQELRDEPGEVSPVAPPPVPPVHG